MEEGSYKKDRIDKIKNLYYSRKDIQKAIFDFSANRETVPRYFEGFGKRPDSLQYPGDIFEMVKKGATSFHCSEEIWRDPLELSTGLNEPQLNELRTGWDLLIDIDSKYIDYSKISAEVIIEMLKFHGIKNLGIKFSGSKGFHIIIPSKAFPREVNGIPTKDMFPEWPRIVTQYISEKTKNQLIKKITELTTTNKYVMDFEAPKKVMPDLILVSPRHLFRMPYSLHEKTSMASVVVDKNKISNFQILDADPLKIKPTDYIPEVREGEASELLMQALDWYKDIKKPEEVVYNKEFKPIKLEKLSDANFPPCVHKILQGIGDGKKRSLFVLINLFRSIGMEKEELEKRIEEWNKKNEHPLKDGYVKTQISWSYRNKPIMPPNCREYYEGLGVCIPDSMCNLTKNPVNYTVKKSLQMNKISNNPPKTSKFKKKN